MTRHTRTAVVSGQAHFISRMPANQSMRIDVVLPVRDQGGLDSFLGQVYDPSSPIYRQFLTVQDFTNMFGPTQENYDAVVRFAKANGFEVAGGSRDAMDVQLKGSVAAIESAFHVTMGVYQHPAENRTFYAPDREPTVDLPFQLTADADDLRILHWDPGFCTDLTTTGPGGAWASETVWVDGGGGISPDHIKIPRWQTLKGVITTANKGSTVYRNGPDVSANSNFTFYVCADQTTCTANLYGGTSFAAPMWAGYLALTNEQAATNGDKPPGLITPIIYQLGLKSGYTTEFHDITSGSNGFPATTGYDLATGWGSPKGSGLINALAP